MPMDNLFPFPFILLRAKVNQKLVLNGPPGVVTVTKKWEA
jgi:hypothetical protein